ncbi:MAG: GtrA family protein [archaeon]
MLDLTFDFFVKLFKVPEKFRTIYKYLFISIVATLIDFFILFILTNYFKMQYILSATISFSIGTLIVFFGNRKFTFKHSKSKFISKRLFLFIIISIICLLLNNGLITFFVELMRNQALSFPQTEVIMLAKLFATIIVFFAKFFTSKKLVFY